MNYKHNYNLLMDRAKNRLLEGYTEKHHIIPKCMGGGNERSNIAKLTPEEHFVAHQLLVKMHPGNLKLLHAAHMMTVCSKSNEKRNNKEYGWLKKRRAEKLRVWALENNIRPPGPEFHTGRKRSEETKQRMSDAAKGKPKSEAHKKALSESRKGCVGTFTGRTHTQTSRQQMAISRSEYNMTFEKADKMRQDVSRGIKRKIVAVKYNVSYGVVCDVIRNNNSWVRPKPIAKAIKPRVDF